MVVARKFRGETLEYRGGNSYVNNQPIRLFGDVLEAATSPRWSRNDFAVQADLLEFFAPHLCKKRKDGPPAGITIRTTASEHKLLILINLSKPRHHSSFAGMNKQSRKDHVNKEN